MRDFTPLEKAALFLGVVLVVAGLAWTVDDHQVLAALHDLLVLVTLGLTARAGRQLDRAYRAGQDLEA